MFWVAAVSQCRFAQLRAKNTIQCQSQMSGKFSSRQETCKSLKVREFYFWLTTVFDKDFLVLATSYCFEKYLNQLLFAALPQTNYHAWSVKIGLFCKRSGNLFHVDGWQPCLVHKSVSTLLVFWCHHLLFFCQTPPLHIFLVKKTF